jgi:hypothetical protein
VKYVDRLSTYRLWPKQLKQDKYELAQAGFFYTKEGDIVECFACGVIVSQWKANDKPLVEHEKWSPDCIYIKVIGSGENKLDILPQWSYGTLSSLNMDL